MSPFLRQFKFLLPLALLAMASSSAEAGFVSMGDESHQALITLESPSLGASASSSRSNEQTPAEPSVLKYLELDQFLVGNSPTSGGMGSVSPVSSGGSSAPAAILQGTILPSEGPVSPLYLREIPFTPQLMIADIFRPPCA